MCCMIFIFFCKLEVSNPIRMYCVSRILSDHFWLKRLVTVEEDRASSYSNHLIKTNNPPPEPFVGNVFKKQGIFSHKQYPY